jgi:DNA mismatch repair protein MutS2
VGDRVHIEKFNRQGTLKKKLGQNRWLVEMGSVESTVNQADIYYAERAKPETPKREKKATVPKKKVSPEIDLRGMRVDEAKIELDKYLDDCALAKIPFVRIIHGYGTFAIRDMVQEVLQESPFIESFRAGQGNEGGAGVTVVYF